MDGKELIQAMSSGQDLDEENYEKLKKWYIQIIDSDAQYIVFVVRRCYILALILETIMNDKIDQHDKVILTDSSFLLACDDLAEYYDKNGQFPKILLCDDVLIHGYNIKCIIENVEKQLCCLLEGKYDPFVVKNALTNALQLKIYCFVEKSAVFLPKQYFARADFMVLASPLQRHKLTRAIAALVVKSGIANASYIYSETINEIQFRKIQLERKEFIKSEYVGNVEYTWVKILNRYGRAKAISILRIIPFKHNRYRVIPFVFIPNLGTGETERLLLEMRNKGIEKEHSCVFFDMLRNELSEIEGRRSVNEWISLILSMAVLHDFKECYSIYNDMSSQEEQVYHDEEREKLFRNYRWNKFEIKEYLEKCINKPILENIRELEETLLCVLDEDRYVLKIKKFFTIGDNRRYLERRLEDYFYAQALREEKESIQILNIGRALALRGRGCCFVLRDLLEDYSEKDIEFGIAYFLQLMDAGVLALSALPDLNVKVIGDAQFAQVGEYALIVKPIRYMEYIPFLAYAYMWCEVMHENYIDHLKEYASSDLCSISEKMPELIEFVYGLQEIKQNPKDWNLDYIEKIDETIQKEKMENIISMIDARKRHLEEYKSYLQKMQ